MLWWAWLLVGFLLVVAELLTPGGFYLLFFGLAGVVVGLLGLGGIVLPAWGQWLLFSALAIGATLIFRKPLLERLQGKMPQPQADDLHGEIAMPVEVILPGAVGKVELRGTSWNARNA
ncbi:MAG: inner membrane protein, partial [Acidobacteriota bacterium]|nr:inner membrane protein [Acidobacteriota bacterium]